MFALIDFFVANVPTWRELLLGGPPCLAWAAGALALAGLLKRRGWNTPYTRKLFHFVIFSSAAVVQSVWGTRVLCLFGAATSGVIFWAVWQGDGGLLYEAIARESDAPYRTYYIVLPYVATFVGGVCANVCFGQFAVVGYLVTGFGDAVGEPVGARFGRHRYRVPSLGTASFTRSCEGSAAVLLVSAAAAASALGSLGITFGVSVVALCLGIGALAALVEAVCPHGWDNTPMQIVPAFTAWALV